MSRDDIDLPRGGAKLFCDLTQSWSEVGGGVRTYLLHKRRHILEATPHRHLMIIPGARDEIVEDGRAVTVTARSCSMTSSVGPGTIVRWLCGVEARIWRRLCSR